MTAQTASKSKAILARVWLFVQGAMIGAMSYGVLAFVASTQIEKAVYSLTAWKYPMFVAMYYGPGMVLGFLLWPNCSAELVQVASGLALSGLAGLSFVIAGRKWGIVIFLLLYAFIIASLTYLSLYMAMIG